MLSDDIKQNVQNVIDHLKQVDAANFDMRSVTKDNSTEDHICLTPACIAGHTDFVAKGKPADWVATFMTAKDVTDPSRYIRSVIGDTCMDDEGLASKYLGLTGKYQKLWDDSNDTETGLKSEILFANEYDYSDATLSDAIATLEHYRDTGEVVWNIK